MKNISISISVFIVLALSLGGCKNVPPVTSGLGSEQIIQGDKFSNHLRTDNPSLAKQLAITDIKSRKTNGLLEINLQLTSSDEKSLQLQYQFNWFDSDGFVIESRKSPWKPVELHGMQTTTLRGVSPNDQVETFTVYVREVPEKAYKF